MITSGGTVQVYGDKTSSSLMTLVSVGFTLLLVPLYAQFMPVSSAYGGSPAIMIPNKNRYLVMHLGFCRALSHSELLAVAPICQT